MAFPTETVYGLGADASCTGAVERIYQIKNRPRSNPLIVHVGDEAMARSVVASWPARAVALTTRFWPGPLTLVLEACDALPGIVTGGGPTVGVRCPDHPLTLALIETFAGPIVGTSANRSGGIAPTAAEHVRAAFDEDEVLVLDGGVCPGGLESTVVSLVDGVTRVLRTGPIGVDAIAEILGERVEAAVVVQAGSARAGDAVIELIATEALGGVPAGSVVLAIHPDRVASVAVVIAMPMNPAEYAAAFYKALHDARSAPSARVLVEIPTMDDGADPLWVGVLERLHRLAGHAPD